MKHYITITFEDFPLLYEEIKEKSFFCKLNILPLEDGKIAVAPGNYNTVGELPDNCVKVNTYHAGGTILVFEDGITLFQFDNTRPSWCEDLVFYLKNKGLNAWCENNDIMVDGYKVAGYMECGIGAGKVLFYGIHISLNVDLSLIIQVCKKPMLKIPRGLSTWGITRQEVLDALCIE